MQYFADSYALVEYVKGNKRYKKYFTKHDCVTTRLNLMELYCATLSFDTEEKAEEYYASFLPKAVSFDDEDLKKAARFRYTHRKRNISYVDGLSYELANALKVKFLTGDKEFKSMENVEYVK